MLRTFATGKLLLLTRPQISSSRVALQYLIVSRYQEKTEMENQFGDGGHSEKSARKIRLLEVLIYLSDVGE